MCYRELNVIQITKKMNKEKLTNKKQQEKFWFLCFWGSKRDELLRKLEVSLGLNINTIILLI